jgi:hypothetical protein
VGEKKCNKGHFTLSNIPEKSVLEEVKKMFLGSFCQLRGLLLTKGTGTKIYVIHNCAFLKIQELHI